LVKIGEVIYFAKGIPFSWVNLDGQELPEQFRRRIEDLYIAPAEECAGREHPFAAGVILVSCIDALARLRHGGDVGVRFKRFSREYVHSFATEHLAKKFYDDFRNGLVHEARLKTGAQFSLELPETVVESGEFLIINPALLAHEVRRALERYVEQLANDREELNKLIGLLKEDFQHELSA
jgi:hypothetical protein